MRNIKILIEFDGSNYCGWQIQQKDRSIQGVLQDRIEELLNEKINLIGSSRTDSGVHAKGMVANFFTNSKIPTNKIPEAINVKLPQDIAVICAEEESIEFHSRYSSKGKRYSYKILNRRMPSPLLKNYTLHIIKELDIEKMKLASEFIKGRHDFSTFKASGSSIENCIRTIWNIEIVKKEDIIEIIIDGDGFLYNMVRIIVGTLIDIGIGKIDAFEMKDIIESHDRKKAGKTVKAQGLCLEKVYY